MTRPFVPLEVLDTELSRALERISGLLTAGGEGITAFDLDFRYLFWSPLMEGMTGMSADEVLGRTVLEVFPSLENTPNFESLIRAAAGESFAVSDRAYSIEETGRRGFFDAYYSPLEALDGRILGGVVMVRDTTERKQDAAALRETEIRFQTMADGSPVMLWMSRTDSLCTFFNQTWLDFTGRTLAEEWGVGWAEGLHPEDFQHAMDTYIMAFNERRAFEMEYRLQRKDGEYRWILDRGVPRYEPGGAFAGFIGSCVDITDRRTLEAELREAVQARDEFLSIASHELRTPLTSLQLQLEMFNHVASQNNAELPRERLRRIVDVSDRQLTRLTGLIESLLDVSRINAGQLPLQLDNVDLSELVRETVERFGDQLAQAGCNVDLQLNRGICGQWDRFRLDQVVVNLLSNAARYAAGSRIEITTRTEERRAILTVRDEGPGIPPEEQQRIFDRFHRSVSSRHFGGLGLGLYIVWHIVRNHGGSIQVESEVGRGTCFIVELPRGLGRCHKADVSASPPRG